MKNKDTYIMAVLVVFGLLLLSRIPAFTNGSLDAIIMDPGIWTVKRAKIKS
jgi:hypothetical protein